MIIFDLHSGSRVQEKCRALCKTENVISSVIEWTAVMKNTLKWICSPLVWNITVFIQKVTTCVDYLSTVHKIEYFGEDRRNVA